MSSDPFQLLAGLDEISHKKPPPIHLWHPEQRKDIDMEIRRDGSWHYLGTPIRRNRLVRLFSTVLRRENDDYYLVTPVEQCRIRVEDVPFQAVLLKSKGGTDQQQWVFTTNVADEVPLNANHPLRLDISEEGEPSPYVMVRDGLEAKLNRNVWYQLVDLLEARLHNSEETLGVVSEGQFVPLCPASALDDATPTG